MLRKILVLLSSLSVLIALFTATPALAASNLSPSPVDFTSLSKNCAVIGIHLDGANHTISCRHAKISPMIGRDNSCDSTVDNMVIFNTSAGNDTILCFWGAGYMAVNILHVNEVDDVAPTNTQQYNAYGEWFRWYQPGTFAALIPGRSKVFASGVTNITVTQLCIGSSDYTYC